jgi:hypothetical protein
LVCKVAGRKRPAIGDERVENGVVACDPRQQAASSVWWRRPIGGLFLGSIVAAALTLNIQRRLGRRRSRGGLSSRADRGSDD